MFIEFDIMLGCVVGGVSGVLGGKSVDPLYKRCNAKRFVMRPDTFECLDFTVGLDNVLDLVQAPLQEGALVMTVIPLNVGELHCQFW